MAAAGDGLAAGDPKAGRAKALVCQACHGTDGLSVVPDAPNIAGQTENYLLTQLAAFKSGTRKSEAMNVVASTLSDQDVANLAATGEWKKQSADPSLRPWTDDFSNVLAAMWRRAGAK